jgi:hypothetical protein
MVNNVTCRQCWKYVFCLVGQDRDAPCRFFEAERLVDKKPDEEKIENAKPPSI